MKSFRRHFAADRMEQGRDQVDDAGDLEVAVSDIAEPAIWPPRRSAPWPATPARRRGGRGIEEQRIAEQRFDLALDLGPDQPGDRAHPVDPLAALLDRLQIVADRLLPRDFGDRADDRLEETGHRRAGRAELEARAGGGVDIDEAPVDLALGGALAQRVHRRAEWRVDQYRSVDQHRAGGSVGGELTRQRAFEECRAGRPGKLALIEHRIEFADREGRERAGEARRRARRESQFGMIGERPRAVIAERDDRAGVRSPSLRPANGVPGVRDGRGNR